MFALFNSDQVYRALAAAVTFKTFAAKFFAPTLKEILLQLGAHIGIDKETVLVRKIGLKRHAGRSDRQNEVWAGKPVNMASKLAAAAEVASFLCPICTSNRSRTSSRASPGCPNDEKVDLWTEVDVTEEVKFDFNTAYRQLSLW